MSGLYSPMVCPRCDNLMREMIFPGPCVNLGRCTCGYRFEDDEENGSVEEYREFFDAKRPRDDDEEHAWRKQWEEWERDSREAAEQLWAASQGLQKKGELWISCSYCARPGAWRLAGTPSGIRSQGCQCGFMRVNSPTLSYYRFGQSTLEIRDGKPRLLINDREVGGEKQIAELVEFLLRFVPDSLVIDNLDGHRREDTRWAISKLLEEFPAAAQDPAGQDQVNHGYLPDFVLVDPDFAATKTGLLNARKDIDELIKIDVRVADWFNIRGNLSYCLAQFGNALNDFDEAIRNDPNDAWGYNSSAWIRATCPDSDYRDGPKAVEAATRACELTEWLDGGYVQTLAAACAETGNFEMAVRFQGQALEHTAASAETRQQMQQRLTLYEAKQPYREP